jgi:hypothetical protein
MRDYLKLTPRILLVLFAFCLLGLAISSAQAAEENIKLSLDSHIVPPIPGNTVDVTVQIDNFTDEQLIDGISVTVEYDSSVVDVVGFAKNAVKFGALLENKLTWEILKAEVFTPPEGATLPNGKRFRIDIWDAATATQDPDDDDPLTVSAQLPADLIVLTFTIPAPASKEERTDLIFIGHPNSVASSRTLNKDYSVEFDTPAGEIGLPVFLSALGAIWHLNGNKIFWEAESQQGNLGWNIYRSETKDGKFVKVNGELIKGAGTTSTPMKYSFIDKDAEKGKVYYYYLEDISFNGEKHRTDLIKSILVNKVTSWGSIKRSVLR